MIKWRLVPWSLWGYGASLVVGTVLVETGAHANRAVLILFAIVMVTWLLLLFGGIRWIWIATVVISIFGIVSQVICASLGLVGGALGFIDLVLLLHPATRRYFSPAGQVSRGRVE